VGMIGGAEAVEAVRGRVVESFTFKACATTTMSKFRSVRLGTSTCLVSIGSELRSDMTGRASFKYSGDVRVRWLRFHHLIHDNEVVLAFWTRGTPLAPSSPDDNGSSS
jgi:hypothetical protein